MLGAVAALGLPGCSAKSKLAADARAPDDFSLSLTVDASAPGGAAWYVVDADGALRIATGARRPDSPVPSVSRQLTPAQMEEVWAQIRSSGLEAAVWELPQSPEAIAAGEGNLVFVSAGRARRAATFPSGDARVASAVEALRSMAWMNSGDTPRQ